MNKEPLAMNESGAATPTETAAEQSVAEVGVDPANEMRVIETPELPPGSGVVLALGALTVIIGVFGFGRQKLQERYPPHLGD